VEHQVLLVLLVLLVHQVHPHLQVHLLQAGLQRLQEQMVLQV
jgi:hypothetical protein